jgi:PAS domain-containing protein
MSFADITHPEDIAASQALLDQFTDGAIETRRIDKRYVRKDGTTLWGILSLTLKKSSSGKPHYLLATVEDITARKQADLDVASLRDALQADVDQETREAGDIVHALRSHIRRRPQLQETAHQIEQRLRAVPGAPTAYVSYWNRQLRCEFVNDAYCARFNCSSDQMVGVALQETVGGAFSELDSHARLALEGHEQRVGHPIELRPGQSLEDIHLVPERIGPDGIQGFFLIFAGRRPKLHLDPVAG